MVPRVKEAWAEGDDEWAGLGWQTDGTARLLWTCCTRQALHRSLGQPAPATALPCPNLGIAGSPAARPNAATVDRQASMGPRHSLCNLDVWVFTE